MVAAAIPQFYERLESGAYSQAVSAFRTEGLVLWSIPGRSVLAGKYESTTAITDAISALDELAHGEVSRPVHAVCVSNDGAHVCVQYLLKVGAGEQLGRFVATDAWHLSDGALAEVWTTFEDLYAFDEWVAAAAGAQPAVD